MATGSLAYHGNAVFPAILPPLRPLAAAPDRRGCLAFQRGHERQVAVALAVVQPVADDEAVGDLEADIAGRQIDLAAGGLRQPRTDLERPRGARAEVAQQVPQRQ